MTKFHRWPLALAMAGTLLSVGCSSEQPTDATPSPEESASPDSSAAPETDSGVLGAGEEALAAGTYEIDLGEEHIPNVTITVPDGWENLDGWGVIRDEDADPLLGITFWDEDEVYAHPCQWDGPRIQPGPTVADLAKTLAAQPLRGATEPVDIVVDGYRGMQLEWSVPANIDFSKCDVNDFRSWTGVAGSWGGSVRYQLAPGQADRLWILDVDGERLVVDALYMPSTDAKDREELWRVMESIRFET